MGSIKDGSDGDINGQVAAILVEADLDVSGAFNIFNDGINIIGPKLILQDQN